MDFLEGGGVLLIDKQQRLSTLFNYHYMCFMSVVSSGYSGFLHQKTDFVVIISPL